MGHEIERVLIDRGHTVLFTVDAGEEAKLATERLEQADVAIEFTTPATAFGNVETCLRAGVPVVCGTTGWNERREEAEKLCEELDGTFFWSSNFSIGVNILFRVSEYLARIMDRFPEYAVSMREVHHTRKKDAPSGTAKQLLAYMDPKHEHEIVYGREGHPGKRGREIGVHAVRGGTVAGEHRLYFFGPMEELELRHRADSREIFALGALRAAAFATRAPNGLYDMDDVIFGGT